jgi:hypothetical protein
MITATELKTLMAECEENASSHITSMEMAKAVKNKPNAERERRRAEKWMDRKQLYNFCMNAIETMSPENMERQRNELLVKISTAEERAYHDLWANRAAAGKKGKPDLKDTGIKKAYEKLLKPYDIAEWKRQLKILNIILK